MAKLCFCGQVQFGRLQTYIFGMPHKQFADNYKDFTFVKFTSQFFSRTDESFRLPLMKSKNIYQNTK